MPFSNRRAFTTFLLFCALSIAWLVPPAHAALGSNCDNLAEIAQKGGVIPRKLTEDYRSTLACVVDRLPRFIGLMEETRDGNARSSQDYWTYLSLTSTTISIFEQNGPDAIRFFRELDDTHVARTLAAGARHGDRQIRLNSANLFSNVVDNSTLCVVLDYLHAPVRESREDNADIIGRANLLYIANVVTTWAYRENAEALNTVATALRAHLATPEMGQFRANLSDTTNGLERVLRNLQKARDGGGLRLPSNDQPYAVTPAEPGTLADCRAYDFQYWTRQQNRFYTPEALRFVLEGNATRSSGAAPLN